MEWVTELDSSSRCLVFTNQGSTSCSSSQSLRIHIIARETQSPPAAAPDTSCFRFSQCSSLKAVPACASRHPTCKCISLSSSPYMRSQPAFRDQTIRPATHLCSHPVERRARPGSRGSSKPPWKPHTLVPGPRRVSGSQLLKRQALTSPVCAMSGNTEDMLEDVSNLSFPRCYLIVAKWSTVESCSFLEH